MDSSGTPVHLGRRRAIPALGALVAGAAITAGRPAPREEIR